MAGAIVAGDGGGIRSDSDRREAGVSHAPHDPTADDRCDPDDGSGCRAERVAHPRDTEDRPDRDDGVRGREKNHVGIRDGVEGLAGWPRPLDVGVLEPHRRDARAVPRPPFLKMHTLAVGSVHVGIDFILGRRNEGRPELPARAESAIDLSERHSAPKPGGARDVHTEVEIPEGEPLWRHTPGLEF